MYFSTPSRGIRQNQLTGASGSMCPARVANERPFHLALAAPARLQSRSSVSISIPRASITRSHSQTKQHRAIHFVSKRKDGLKRFPRGDGSRSNQQQSGVGSLP